MNVEQCECHDCTQARYRQSFRYQFDQAMNPIKHQTIAPKPEAPEEIKDLLLPTIEGGFYMPEIINERLAEAFRRGKASR